MTQDIKTTETHWDCECERNYIHLKAKAKCSTCGASSDEQPDSRAEEVEAMLNRTTSNGPETRS